MSWPYIPRTRSLIHWCPRWLDAGAMGIGEKSQDEDCCWWGDGPTGQNGGNVWWGMPREENLVTIEIVCYWLVTSWGWSCHCFFSLINAGTCIRAIGKDHSDSGLQVTSALSNKKCQYLYTPYTGMLNCFRCIQLFETPWTIATRLLCPGEFARRGHWSGLRCPPPGGLPYSGIKLVSLTLLHWQVGSLPPVPPGKLIYRLPYLSYSLTI